MITTFIRSSSYNAHSMCPQNYFMEYVLGWRGKSGQKADKGTIVHKVLEVMAIAKKGLQENKPYIEDEIAGRVNTSDYNVDDIVDIVYDYYSKSFDHHTWTDGDLKDCREWTWLALNFRGGLFDPRNRDILEPELAFDFTIDEPWAKYDFELDGERLQGQLGIKGTVDLITKVDDMYEIIDWKTGGYRKDWATGKTKDLEYLKTDPQLRLYHYAVSKTLPEIDSMMVTIFFIRAGGPFTIYLDRSDMAWTENMLREKFEKIKQTEVPRLNKSFFCTKLCNQGMTTFEGTNVRPMQENRLGQVCRKGSIMTKCEQTRYMIQEKGIQWVTENWRATGHKVDKYKAPGEVEQKDSNAEGFTIDKNVPF